MSNPTATPAAPTALVAAADPALRALAVKTDTAIAALDEAYARIAARYDGTLSTLRSIDGQRATYRGRRRVYTATTEETIESITAKLADGRLGDYDLQTGKNPHQVLGSLVTLDAELADNRDAANKLHDVWAANGYWTRYFVVQGGHIHNDISNRCSRTWTTQHGWTPEMSGATEAEAVAELGPLLCTHCFPTAPVEFTKGHDKPEACEGSGKAGKEGTRYRTGMRIYADCQHCSYRGQLTSSGYAIRKHQPQK